MKIKYWLKMKIEANSLNSWVMQCEHIGEVKLFGYILATFNPNDMSWSYDKYKEEAIKKTFSISKATVFNYLKNMCKNKLLIKKARGLYQVNEEFIEFGSKKD